MLHRPVELARVFGNSRSPADFIPKDGSGLGIADMRRNRKFDPEELRPDDRMS